MVDACEWRTDVRLPPSEREIAYRLPSPDGAGVLDWQLRFDHPDPIESVVASRRGEGLAKFSLLRFLKSLVDETQMRIECIVGTARVAVPCRLEHSLRLRRFGKLDEHRLSEARSIVQPIDVKLDRREPGRDRAGGRPSLASFDGPQKSVTCGSNSTASKSAASRRMSA
jgi:hypothetical protein